MSGEKKSTKINFLGPDTARWGGGLPREGVGVEKFVPSLKSLSSLGFEGRNLRRPRIFAGISQTPGAPKKCMQKKVYVHFSAPIAVAMSPVRRPDPPNLGGEDSPPKFRGRPSKDTKQRVSDIPSPNLGGAFPPIRARLRGRT